MPSSTTKKYGISAETRKRRRRIATRWKEMTDIAFSSTVNASALKNTSVRSSTLPITRRCSTKLRSSSTSASERPGTTNARYSRSTPSSRSASNTCDSTIMTRMRSGTSESNA
jgi:hypothetical protein